MRKAWALIVLAVVSTAGCNQGELRKALADAKASEAQKDSLLTEVLETTQFVSDVKQVRKSIGRSRVQTTTLILIGDGADDLCGPLSTASSLISALLAVACRVDGSGVT